MPPLKKSFWFHLCKFAVLVPHELKCGRKLPHLYHKAIAFDVRALHSLAGSLEFCIFNQLLLVQIISVQKYMLWEILQIPVNEIKLFFFIFKYNLVFYNFSTANNIQSTWTVRLKDIRPRNSLLPLHAYPCHYCQGFLVWSIQVSKHAVIILAFNL